MPALASRVPMIRRPRLPGLQKSSRQLWGYKRPVSKKSKPIKFLKLGKPSGLSVFFLSFEAKNKVQKKMKRQNKKKEVRKSRTHVLSKLN